MSERKRAGMPWARLGVGGVALYGTLYIRHLVAGYYPCPHVSAPMPFVYPPERKIPTLRDFILESLEEEKERRKESNFASISLRGLLVVQNAERLFT